jgi:uncharacterized delta-60 repeat protein
MKAYRVCQVGFIVFVLGCVCLVQNIQAGELDAGFGNNGRIATSVGNYGDQAYAVALQQDDRILVGGSSSNGADLDFALVRYHADGTLDLSFNYDGTVTTQVGRGDDEIAALAVQDDGYIVAAGYSINDGSRDFALARYTPDGERDTAFGVNGIVVTPFTDMDDEITAMAVDDEGRIVVAGYSTGTAGRVVIVGRYLANGELDPTFASEGVGLTGVGDDALARSIDFDADNRIVVAGSYYNEDQTEVMVLRFTDSGDLDTTFGEDGLALPAYTIAPTEGFGVKVHESGAILVAGSVGSPGELDTALFNFTGKGLPDVRFGDNGMLVVEASREDDMALALDLKGDAVYLSGFTAMQEVREFLLVTLQVSYESLPAEEIPEIESVPFVLRTGDTTTSLQIGERQVEDSYDDYMAATADEGVVPLQTTVSTTPFGFFSVDTSYAVVAQPDGKAVAAGVSEENGVLTFAVARFEGDLPDATAAAASSGITVGWITTKEPTEVNRTGAFTGGIITATDVSITKRGVVFSIAPDPVLKSGGDGGDPNNPDNPGGGEDTTPPSITVTAPTGPLPSGTTETTLSVTTDEDASCKYSETAGTDYDAMQNNLLTVGGTTHSTTISGLTDGDTFYIRCKDNSGNKNTSDTVVTIKIGSSQSAGMETGYSGVKRVAGLAGSFMVATANAADTPDNPADTAAPEKTKSIFDTTDTFLEEGSTEDGAGPGTYSSILKNLKPGTFYYIRAYAVSSGGSVYYGNQLGLQTADSCFIATAAYGSIFHSSVKILRDVRDRYLVTNVPGRIFINLYYAYSPPIADVIAGNELLRFIVRMLLLPVVAVGWLLLHIGVPGVLLAAVMSVLSFLLFQRTRQRA